MQQSTGWTMRASRLYYACLGGLLWAARDLAAGGADVNSQGGQYCNALQAASYKGSLEVTQLLLDKEVNVNAQGGKYGNALRAASRGGNTEIVQLLNLPASVKPLAFMLSKPWPNLSFVPK
ncbi:hypothetical protein SNK04_013586 [Fusarium graminearum]